MSNSKKILSDDLVSIIMPAYNSELYIKESIYSVIKQTYNNWELIIINDASKDETLEIIKEVALNNSKIKIINLIKNVGVSKARNKGIEFSQGRYIAFLDSDDIWLPKKLEIQIEFMKKNEVSFSFTQYRVFNENVLDCGKLIDVSIKLSYNDLLKGNTIGCLTVILDKKNILNFRMSNDRHEDYLAWLNILRMGNYAYGIKEDLARYRISKNSLTANKFKSAFWTWSVYRSIENISILDAFCYFFCYMMTSIKKYYIK